MAKLEGKKVKEARRKAQEMLDNAEEALKDFELSVKRDIVDIINDAPSLVKLGDKEYVVKDMRYYSINRICRLTTKMMEEDKALDDDNKVITALCTDLDAMCEIVAIILCNHLFTADGAKYEDIDSIKTRNDQMVETMKMKVLNSTFDTNQWAAIILGAIKSIDLGGFFLLRKSVNMLTDSLLMRKKKSVETALQFTEALSLQMQQTS
jgi:hypothetical protein